MRRFQQFVSVPAMVTGYTMDPMIRVDGTAALTRNVSVTGLRSKSEEPVPHCIPGQTAFLVISWQKDCRVDNNNARRATHCVRFCLYAFVTGRCDSIQCWYGLRHAARAQTWRADHVFSSDTPVCARHQLLKTDPAPADSSQQTTAGERLHATRVSKHGF